MITLLDPSLKNNKGESSTNLGDLIIRQSVIGVLKDIFPYEDIHRLSTHSNLESAHYKLIKDSQFTFIGGSNLLSSNILLYNQWKIANRRSLYFLAPKIKDAILMGVGWWQYQNKPSFITKRFYNSVLNHKYNHSVRDQYTELKVNQLGMKNVLNTSCPTLWDLDGVACDRKKTTIKKAIFTLTDYNKNQKSDSQLINLLFDYFDELYFFAQGSMDKKYLLSMSIYSKNKEKIKLVNSVEEYENYFSSGETVYVGTRLHGGIYALKQKAEALIIAIDNRASEISKSTNLAVIKRGENDKIRTWLEGKTNFGKITLDNNSIELWKNQFR